MVLTGIGLRDMRSSRSVPGATGWLQSRRSRLAPPAASDRRQDSGPELRLPAM